MDKTSGSENAGQFLRDQIRLYERRLIDAEEELARFNRENYDRLPSMQGGYFQRLQDETRELSEARTRLSLARSRLEQINQQLRGESARVSPQGEIDPNSIDARAFEAERRLDDLLLRYTESHPEVIATREIVRKLRERKEQEVEAVAGGQSVPSNNPVYQALRIARNESEEELATLQADVSVRKARVDELRTLIDEVPQVEAELARLNRDYEVINSNYQALLSSLEREQLSTEVFQNEQIDFRIIEPASAGTIPVAPKRGLLLFMVFVVGCGAAIGSVYVLSQVISVVGNVDALQVLSPGPVIGAVSRVLMATEHRQMIQSGLYVALAFVGLGLTFGGVFVFEVLGPGLRSYI